MATDRYKATLSCATCKTEGVAHLEQEDGWAFVKGNTATTVDSVSPGFKAVRDPSRPTHSAIHCVTCGSTVWSTD